MTDEMHSTEKRTPFPAVVRAQMESYKNEHLFSKWFQSTHHTSMRDSHINGAQTHAIRQNMLKVLPTLVSAVVRGWHHLRGIPIYTNPFHQPEVKLRKMEPRG